MHRDQLEDAILETLVEDAPLHANEIAQRIDGHPLTVDRICARLNEEGHIYPLAGGQYEITSSGKHRIADESGTEIEAEPEVEGEPEIGSEADS